MAATGTKALPYPVPSDPVPAGADNMRKLAQSVDNMVQTGTAAVNITAADTNATVTVTFPVPFATGTPVIVSLTPATGLSTSANQYHYYWASGVSETGFTAGARRSGSVNPFNLRYIAVGPVATVA